MPGKCALNLLMTVASSVMKARVYYSFEIIFKEINKIRYMIGSMMIMVQCCGL